MKSKDVLKKAAQKVGAKFTGSAAPEVEPPKEVVAVVVTVDTSLGFRVGDRVKAYVEANDKSYVGRIAEIGTQATTGGLESVYAVKVEPEENDGITGTFHGLTPDDIKAE